MAENVSLLDRVARVIGGFILIILIAYEQNSMRSQLLGIFAIYGVMSGSMGSCVVYGLLGIRTTGGKG
ncbi:DUF2892 domain-containing protein [Candidatus Pacearchaeota archaeon]|nr:DUF2892 domain-containing protein [Candidatus Pacearchaeota archaeon]